MGNGNLIYHLRGQRTVRKGRINWKFTMPSLFRFVIQEGFERARLNVGFQIKMTRIKPSHSEDTLGTSLDLRTP